MKLGQQIVTCEVSDSVADATITQAIVNANQENTGYLAVTLVDNETTSPVPSVRLTNAASEAIYGVVATFNGASQRCGVITGGVVPVRKMGAGATVDIGKGMLTVAAGGSNENIGKVEGQATAGAGRGTIVGYTGEVLWVDLDVNVNAV